jgi:Methyltransferase domain
MTPARRSFRPYRQQIMRILRTFAADPVTVGRALPGEFRQRWERHTADRVETPEPEEAWEERLHEWLDAPWPCPEGERLDALMADIGERLVARGLSTGRHTYGWYSDAENSLGHAIWCTTLHKRPDVVIETGVAHGVTSQIVLEALGRNGRGHLWSIDLPHPLDRRLHKETGAAVTDACRERWSYLEGSSRQRLPALTAETGRVHLFIHDSLHTARNMLFEAEQAASVMAAGAVLLVDDIGSHDGFVTFARKHPEFRTIVCPSADRLGVFGIAVKTA